MADIPIVNDNGERALVPAENLSKAEELGFRVETVDEQIHAERLERAGESKFQAGAEAVGRGATLGLSDVLLKQFRDEEEIADAAARREYLGGYGTALEAAGGLATTLATGGLGTAALGAGLTARLGGGAAAKLAGTALAGGLETGLQAGGAELSEAALENRDIRAEKLLASMGLGFAMGGAGAGILGAGGMAAGAAANKAKEAVQGAVAKGITGIDKLRKIATGAAEEAGEAAAHTAPAVGAVQDAAAAAKSVAGEPDVQEMAKGAMKNFAKGIPNEADLEQGMRDWTKKQADKHRINAMGFIQSDIKSATKAKTAEAAQKKIDSIVKTSKDLDLVGDISNPAQNLQRALDRKEQLIALGADFEDQIDTLVPNSYNPKSAINAVERLFDGMSNLEKGRAGEAMRKFELIKQDFADMAKHRTTDKLNFGETRELLTQLDTDIKNAFSSKSESAAILRDMRQALRDDWMEQVERNAGKEMRDKIKQNNIYLSDLYAIEDAGQAAVRRLTGNRGATLTTNMAGMAGLMMSGGNPLVAAAMAGANKLWREYGDSVSMKALNYVADHPALGNIARSVTGLKGSMLNEAGSTAANETIKQASTLARTARAIGTTMTKGVDAIFTGAPHIARKQVGDAMPQLTDMLGSALGVEDEKTEHGKFNITKTDLAKLANDPEMMMNRMNHAMNIQRAADPQSSADFAATVANGVKYLQSIAPKAPAPNSILGAKPWRPSDQQLHEYQNAVNIVMSPLDVLEKIREGTLTTGDTKALQAVYPALYTELRKQVAEAAQRQGDRLSYARRLAVGRFLAGPEIERTSNPQYVAMMQGNYSSQGSQPQPQQAPQQGYVPRRASAKTPNLSSFAVTESQRIAGRGAA